MFLGPLALVGGFFTIVPPGNPREQYGGGSLKKLKIELSCDPLPGIYPKKAIIQKDTCTLGFPGISVVKNLPAMHETRVQSLVQEDPTCCGAVKPMCHNYFEPVL